MAGVKHIAATAAPVVPTAQAVARLSPFGQDEVRLLSGLLHDRQRQNRQVTIRHGLEEIERAGALENFRIAAGLTEGARRGMTFSDSDVYKWLEAVAWEVGREPSDELATLADEVIAVVASAQGDDGYLNTYCQIEDPSWRWTDLEMGHELYCAGHLIQAGVAFARATGDQSLLQVARRFADLIDETFRLGPQTGTDGHPIIEMALIELYRLTEQQRYLKLAQVLIERRGQHGFPGGQFAPDYYQEATPVRKSTTIVGHAVRALYLLSGVTDLAQELGDTQLLAAATAQWDDLVTAKLYLTGGIGSRHYGEAIGDPYELPPDRAYCETCASIASIMWNWRMLLSTGEAQYADLIERTLYNGFLSGIGATGDTFFYVNPLHSRGHHRPRAAWDPVACCPPNIMRVLASVQQYLATYDSEGIQIHQYADATISCQRADARCLGVRVVTRYPWSGRVEITITDSDTHPWTVSLRLPSWASVATIDGQAVRPAGYIELTREWRVGDRVVLDLDTTPRVVEAHPRIDALRGCVAIERGPLVFCLEDADLPEGVDLADVYLRRAVLPRLRDGVATLEGTLALEVDAEVVTPHGWGAVEYRDVQKEQPAPTGEPINVTAIPYFLWGNRNIGGAMRVWMPQSTRTRGA